MKKKLRRIAVFPVQLAVQIAMGRVYALKNVRLFYKKKGRMKFISHLDMNRFFTRILRKSNLPIWYTEGFNPHPYITFAAPLSLGFESEYEIMDFRLTDDDFSLEKAAEILKTVVPEYIEIISLKEPVMKAGKIGFAGYELTFENKETAEKFYDFISSDSVIVSKKTKKGDVKVIDVADKIQDTIKNGEKISLVLPSGNENINPSVIVAAFNEKEGKYYYVSYLRTALYNEQKSLFL
jgi:radical SAM-linked protein